MKANYLKHAGLMTVFAGALYLVSQHIAHLEKAPALYFVLAGFATFRMARTISFNGVMDWLRAPFAVEVEDSSGAGLSTEAKPGPFQVIGELLCCPICSGTWSALILSSLYCLDERIGWAAAAVFGLAGISEVLHWGAEALEWAGRNQREQAGSEWLWKNKGIVKPAPEDLLKLDHLQRFKILG